MCVKFQVKTNAFKVTKAIFIDVNYDDEKLGRIEIGLFGEDAPKTVENFRQICINGIDGLSYAGTRFHRVIDKFMIQGGDIVAGDGTGSISEFIRFIAAHTQLYFGSFQVSTASILRMKTFKLIILT